MSATGILNRHIRVRGDKTQRRPKCFVHWDALGLASVEWDNVGVGFGRLEQLAGDVVVEGERETLGEVSEDG